MKTKEEIKNDIITRFEDKVENIVEQGSMIDIYSTVLSEVGRDIYDEIDRNRTPHIYTSLEGQQLDDEGIMLNLPRKDGEDDHNYKYRLMNWTLSNEAANETAINDALLMPTYASNIEFRPKVYGCGTGVCYVIPKKYTDEYITNSLIEAKEIIDKVANPGLYVEYIVPNIIGVKLQIYIKTEDGDIDTIKSNIESNIIEYINNIPPYGYIQVGQINRIGLSESKVQYFNVMGVFINGQVNNDVAIYQDIDTKYLFDTIIWNGDD